MAKRPGLCARAAASKTRSESPDRRGPWLAHGTTWESVLRRSTHDRSYRQSGTENAARYPAHCSLGVPEVRRSRLQACRMHALWAVVLSLPGSI